jgi:hypothetical protein
VREGLASMPAVDETLIIIPERRERMEGMMCRQRVRGPKKFVSSWARHS